MNLPNEEHIESRKINITARIIKYNGNYTIYSEGSGGAIITDANKEEAERRFTEAIKASYALRNLIFYADMVKEMNGGDLDSNIREFKTPKINIEYLTVAA
ncbi:MAG: hypothetical protein U0T74_09130 [Chitinophagales bacterium]